MTTAPRIPSRLDPAAAAALMADLGFLAYSDLPDRPGPAYLLVALRESPSLHHYDPEAIEYWAGDGGRGVPRSLTRETPLPIDTEFSWGLIRIVDRLRVTNEYLTFGGRLSAARVDGVVIAVFTSPAPLLRRGGHSQIWDRGAESVGAFFSRVLLAVDYAPGFEDRMTQADPVARYAAFVVDTLARYRTSPLMRLEQPELWTLLLAEERRLKASDPSAWRAGEALRLEAVREAGPSPGRR
jgi:hypothetical protein